jgi:hypothetical protein
MLIAKIENKQVTSIGDYRDLLPHISHPTSGPDFGYLNSLGWYPVSVFKPYNRQTQKLSVAEPYFEDNFVYTVQVEPLTQEELLALNEAKVQEIRAVRDTILTQTVDKINAVRWNSMTESKRQEWSVYRQALLDITIQPNFPLEVIWPTQPD